MVSHSKPTHFILKIVVILHLLQLLISIIVCIQTEAKIYFKHKSDAERNIFCCI